jgi:hypothetical protein
LEIKKKKKRKENIKLEGQKFHHGTLCPKFVVADQGPV